MSFFDETSLTKLATAGPLSGSDQEPITLSEGQALDLLLEQNHTRIAQLLPVKDINLASDQKARVSLWHEARLVLGPAASAPMNCAGEKCPIAFQCPLVKLKSAPLNEPCPFEQNYVVERFHGWLRTFKLDLDSITEIERITISNLVYLDVEEDRIRKQLANAQNASLIVQSVRDVDVETKEPLCWEYEINPLVTRLNEITTTRRMLMKDFELTPEMKTKRKKALGVHAGDDLASRQSKLGDKIRGILSKRTAAATKTETSASVQGE